MTTNIGTIDRVFRFVLGIILLAAPFVSGLDLFNSSTATIISVIVGLVMVGTSALKFCPLYRIFGIKTCKL
ncbi:YgaP family membrane protein [Sulfitobacter sp.]|uniref:YgaP family membrane protein n=1 Tax=Sulfitobacter sp. TaxID=1903071 RepID=UPI003F6A93F9